jgi:hypothetical protein
MKPRTLMLCVVPFCYSHPPNPSRPINKLPLLFTADSIDVSS